MNERTASALYDLAAVDIIRERLGVGYKDARDALQAAGGDVVDALAWLEAHNRGSADKLSSFGERLAQRVRDALADQKIADIRIKLIDTVVADYPVAACGAAAALLVLAAELISNCSVEVQYAQRADEELSE